MKLAEALVLRADLNRRIAQLRERLNTVAKVQEGDRPAEDPQALLAELERAAVDLTGLIQRINRTNSVTELEPGVTLSDALAKRDTLRLRHSYLRDLARHAVITHDRYSRSEVKFVSTVDIAEIQQQADSIAIAYRELDTRIQQANWTIDVID